MHLEALQYVQCHIVAFHASDSLILILHYVDFSQVDLFITGDVPY